MKMTVGAADSGNSRTKWAVFEDGLLVDHGSWPDQKLSDGEVAQTACHWKLAGVHPERLATVKNDLESRGKTCEILSDPGSIGLKLDLQYPEKVGIDRVAAAWASWLRAGRRHSCMVVDAGTAVTIDLVDKNGTFRGGAILPGLDLMLKSLADGTRLLPRFFPSDLPHRSQWPGRNTVEAIAAGTQEAQIGAVTAFISMARNKDPDVRVFITGGGGDFIGKGLNIPHEMVPTLVLEGIAKAGAVVA
jgi:type III pantothenate kinase